MGRPRGRWVDGVWRDAVDLLRKRKWEAAGREREVRWKKSWGGGGVPWLSNGQKRRRGKKRSGG